jgi:hypothetical protein
MFCRHQDRGFNPLPIRADLAPEVPQTIVFPYWAGRLS